MKNPIKVLLCDDRPMMRERCREMLAGSPEILVVGDAEGGFAGITMASALQPDVVVMDFDMPDLDGVQATRKILAANPRIKVLAYSSGNHWQTVQDMVDAGASGYAIKGDSTAEFLRAIQTVMAGGHYLSDKIEIPAKPTPRPARHSNNGAPRRAKLNAFRIGLVDESALVRKRLADLLSTIDGFEVAGEASDYPGGVRLIEEGRLDAVILDLDLRPRSGIELLKTLKKSNPAMTAVILTNYDEPKLEKWCLDLGADHFLRKTDDVERIVEICRGLVSSKKRNGASQKSAANSAAHQS